MLSFQSIWILRSLISAMFFSHCSTRSLYSLRLPSQIITKVNGTPHNGSAVPGDSLVKYHNDPANDLFKIESLDMYPNPCVLYVSSSLNQIGQCQNSTLAHLCFQKDREVVSFKEGRKQTTIARRRNCLTEMIIIGNPTAPF